MHHIPPKLVPGENTRRGTGLALTLRQRSWAP
jgi:hypothetical protein